MKLSPEEIVSAAISEHRPVAMRVGFSGGRDSLAITHWMMTHYPETEVFHINTGIGIERTRQFVRDTCKEFGWKLHEIRAKEDCGQDYDKLVRKWGFPGKDGHTVMYNRLKERGIEKMVRECGGRKKRVLIVTGIRHDESRRRMRYGGREVNRKGSQVWCNPIYWWSAAERDDYIKQHNLPINPVSQLLGMSGECLCGAYAHKGEKALVRLVCPETADRIDRLEQEVLARGFTWNWEGSPPKGGHSKDQIDMWMPMCVGCEK